MKLFGGMWLKMLKIQMAKLGWKSWNPCGWKPYASMQELAYLVRGSDRDVPDMKKLLLWGGPISETPHHPPYVSKCLTCVKVQGRTSRPPGLFGQTQGYLKWESNALGVTNLDMSTALPSTNQVEQRERDHSKLSWICCVLVADRDFGKGEGCLQARASKEKLSSVSIITIHVSQPGKKCNADEPLVVPLDRLHIDDKLHFVEEPLEIVGREVKRLKRSWIPLVKVQWNSRESEFTSGNVETYSRENTPHLISHERAIFKCLLCIGGALRTRLV
ncbi:hypothetical protein Tco_0214865 [Tanacetum coccineum]